MVIRALADYLGMPDEEVIEGLERGNIINAAWPAQD